MPLEIGQRVIFRSLQWEVADNSSDAVVELFGRDRLNQGEIVRAILGLEPITPARMPDLTWTIGTPGWSHLHWKALHDAFRLTLAHGRGNLSSVDWGRLILEPYQLVPLQRIENLPFPRLLIADDTGLGKTAEAGLILFRLMQRRRAERVLVLCRARPEPERWQQELREKFGIEAEVINDGQDYARLRRSVPAHLNVFAYVPRLIMSMHFAAQPHIVDELRRDVRWDTIIIDEAHHLAERGSSRKRLWELAQVVCGKSDNDPLLLLTATPHDGKGESFASLIRLLDPYAVVDPDRLDPAIVRPLVVRRLKTQVVKADGSRFVRRSINVLDVEPYRSKAERALDKGLRGYTNQLRKRAEQLAEIGERNRAMGASFLESFLRKRLASSVTALRESLPNRLKVVQGQALLVEPEDVTDDVSQAALNAEVNQLPDGRSEEEVLIDLIARAEKIAEGDEAKVKALTELLDRILADRAEKVIIFTEFVDTLEMLSRVLDRSGRTGQYVTYHGATPNREAQRRKFLTDPQTRIFLATDAASEGINLQEACRVLIHVEVPWNPNRYEQRNGRIDRYGQTQRPEVYLLVAAQSLEQRVAEVVVRKLEMIAEQVGSVSNVFPLVNKVDIDEFLARADAEQVEAAAVEMDRQLDVALAESQAELDEQISTELLRGDGFGDAEMAAIDAALAEARTLVPEFRDVEEFLRTYFQAEGGTIEPTGDDGIVRVSVPRALRPEINGVEKYARATFRRDVAVAEKDREAEQRVEFLSPGHPLVRAALRRMRGKVYAADFASRVSYRRVVASETPGFVFTFAQRFLDGRGEAIEERFEPVFVALTGPVSTDSESDRRKFLLPSRGNLTPDEQRVLTSRFKADFERARDAAQAEALRRQAERVKMLSENQDHIAEDALIRLGRWEQASQQRIDQRLTAMGAQQMDLFGVVARRLRQFQKEQEQLLRQKETRRAEIRAMKQVRADALDAIGALVVFPEGLMQ
jgi:superfamily II DNA or RNA helicase